MDKPRNVAVYMRVAKSAQGVDILPGAALDAFALRTQQGRTYGLCQGKSL